MRSSRVSEEEVLVKIAEAFRRYGYDGASVRLLAKATGLEPASLYTRFPGGKEEMALKVVARACELLAANVFEILRGPGAAGTRSKTRRDSCRRSIKMERWVASWIR